MFFSQYDTNEDHQIDEEEAARIFRDLSLGKVNFTGVGIHDKHPSELKIGGLDPPTQEELDE